MLDCNKIQRNLDPLLHPYQKPRELVDALNAVKLDKIFAKPFITSLNGHIDSVMCIEVHGLNLNYLISASGDGGLQILIFRNSTLEP